MTAAAPVIAATINSGDTAWVLVSTALVLFMTIPGLSLLYAGMVRAKNALTVFMQCFAITAMVSVLWMLIGYSLSFDRGGAEVQSGVLAFFGGFGRLALSGLTADAVHPNAPTIPETVYCMFQLTFAVITPALVISAFVERVKFSSVMLFTALWSLVVYAPICHMVWSGSGSFLYGTLDYAGGCVVEINSGVSGLVAALMVGRRRGYPQHPVLPHSIVLAVVGGGMLWVGWFGFNAGSAVAANAAAGMAMLNTHLAAAVATCAWMAIEWIRFGKPSVLGAVTGSLAGLVAITPAAGYVAPSGAVVLALVATACCYVGCTWLKRRLGYDDALDVFGVHGIAGLVGTLLLGIFGTQALGGTAATGIGEQTWIQAKAVLVTVLWAGGGTAICCLIVRLIVGLRVEPRHEDAGLDLHQHGEVAYSIDARV
jgi:ammonium transporter, Amt family